MCVCIYIYIYETTNNNNNNNNNSKSNNNRNSNNIFPLRTAAARDMHELGTFRDPPQQGPCMWRRYIVVFYKLFKIVCIINIYYESGIL